MADDQLVEVPNADFRAAERVDGEPCSYPNCENDADYRVEVWQGVGIDSATTFCLCDDCSRRHRIWVVENGVLDRDIDDRLREDA